MADTSRRVPLWAIALVGDMGVFTILGLFLFGSYSGLGSSF
jgi:photosystem II PsbJ protein